MTNKENNTRKNLVESTKEGRKSTGEQKLLGAKEYLSGSFSSDGEKAKEFIEKVYSISELVVEMQEELREMVIKAGIKVLEAMLEEDRKRLVGERYKHQESREASRYGYTTGKVVMGGRKVSIRKPRARTAEGEVKLPTYELYSNEDPLERKIMDQILIGVSTRKYENSLEEIPEDMESCSTSRSNVSRRFVRMTQKELEEKLAEPIEEEIVALMIDGIEIAEHTIIVVLGITADGKKKVLGIRYGTTENATVSRELLRELNERGLPVDKKILVTIDGGKGIRKALNEVFGQNAVIQRCQVHKKRNVLEHLPEVKRPWVRRIMNEAYNETNYERSRNMLLSLAHKLEQEYPSATASLLEGLEETLTVIKLGLPLSLRKSFASTNLIESMLSTIRSVQRNVKRWRDGKMIMRWTLIGALEAEKKFRRVKGCKYIYLLINSLANYKEIENVA